jgi:hypothetical protein
MNGAPIGRSWPPDGGRPMVWISVQPEKFGYTRRVTEIRAAKCAGQPAALPGLGFWVERSGGSAALHHRLNPCTPSAFKNHVHLSASVSRRPSSASVARRPSLGVGLSASVSSASVLVSVSRCRSLGVGPRCRSLASVSRCRSLGVRLSVSSRRRLSVFISRRSTPASVPVSGR